MFNGGKQRLAEQPKNTQVRVLLLKNNMTQVEVKSSPPNKYLSKSKKVLSKKSTQGL